MSVHLLKAEALPALAKRANAAHHAGIDRFIEAGKALLAASIASAHGAVGLTGPWGSTETSPELKVRLRAIMKSLGPLTPLPRQVADESE